MRTPVITAQNKAIKHLRDAISNFVSRKGKTRVIPLAIPTGWGKTRIAVRAILDASYCTPPVVVIWPQKHSHIQNVWRECTHWCNKRSKRRKDCDGHGNCGVNEKIDIKYIKPSKPGPKSRRHVRGAGSYSKKFDGTFYSVNNRFTGLGIYNTLKKTKGPIIFVIDEWHSKQLLEKFRESEMDAERFWRDTLLGETNKKVRQKKLFVILISATPIGATSDMDTIKTDDTFKENIESALKYFSVLTGVGNQKREYNLSKIYPKVIKSEEKKLGKAQKDKHSYHQDDRTNWIREYVKLSKKALRNKAALPDSSQVYALESLLHSGVTNTLADSTSKCNFCR